MNRFEMKHKKFNWRIFTPLFVLLTLLIFLLLFQSMQNNNIERSRAALETALNRDIAHCYAMEGFYPPSLSYLEEHYGLTYDHDLFFVDYNPIASNLYPDITLFIKGEKQDES